MKAGLIAFVGLMAVVLLLMGKYAMGGLIAIYVVGAIIHAATCSSDKPHTNNND